MLWLINVSPRFVVCWVLLCDVLLLFSLPGRPSWHQSPHGWEVLLMRTSSSLSIRRSKHFTRFTFIDLANTFLLFIYMYYLISHVCINHWPRYEFFSFLFFLSFFFFIIVLLIRFLDDKSSPQCKFQTQQFWSAVKVTLIQIPLEFTIIIHTS